MPICFTEIHNINTTRQVHQAHTLHYVNLLHCPHLPCCAVVREHYPGPFLLMLFNLTSVNA